MSKIVCSRCDRSSKKGTILFGESVGDILGSCHCVEIKTKKTNKGAHGGGNEYQQMNVENEFYDLADKALHSKKKPGKSSEANSDPGDGETGEKPYRVTPPTGFKQSKDGLPKDKDKPGKATKNESFNKMVDKILNEPWTND